MGEMDGIGIGVLVLVWVHVYGTRVWGGIELRQTKDRQGGKDGNNESGARGVWRGAVVTHP